MIETRAIAPISPLPMELLNGIIKLNTINNVSKTAICAMALFWFFTPRLQATSKTPKITGIKAVIDGLSEVK